MLCLRDRQVQTNFISVIFYSIRVEIMDSNSASDLVRIWHLFYLMLYLLSIRPLQVNLGVRLESHNKLFQGLVPIPFSIGIQFYSGKYRFFLFSELSKTWLKLTKCFLLLKKDVVRTLQSSPKKNSVEIRKGVKLGPTPDEYTIGQF